jgi:hypothetical protein
MCEYIQPPIIWNLHESLIVVAVYRLFFITWQISFNVLIHNINIFIMVSF